MTTAAATPQATSPRLLERPFLLLASAQSATYAAEFFSYVAMSWLALQLTGSGAVVGALLATQAIPRAVLMLVGGAIVDRFTPFAVMIASGAVRAVLVGALAGLVLTGAARPWELFPVAAVLGVLGAFYMPAQSSALPQVVEKEALESANAVIFIASQLAAVAGPAAAGLVVARWGSGPAFAVDSAGYLVAAAACVPLRRLGGKVKAEHASDLLRAIRDGFAFVWRDAMLRALLLAIIALNFASSGPFQVGVAVIAKQRWGGAWALGIETGAIGLGAILGAAISGRLRERFPLGWAVVGIAAAFAIGLPLIGIAATVWVAAGITVALGIINGYIYVIGMSWLQRRTPPEMLGRMMSLLMVGSFGVGPVSYAIAAALVGFNTELVFLFGGIVCAAAAIGSAASRSVRATR